jgi:hypothetical protein
VFDSCLSESIAGGVRGNFNDLLKRYHGITQLESVEGGTKLRFHSESIPETVIPLGLAHSLIEGETREHYQEIRNEVLRRRGVRLVK